MAILNSLEMAMTNKKKISPKVTQQTLLLPSQRSRGGTLQGRRDHL
jgi:hypothetical protein